MGKKTITLYYGESDTSAETIRKLLDAGFNLEIRDTKLLTGDNQNEVTCNSECQNKCHDCGIAAADGQTSDPGPDYDTTFADLRDRLGNTIDQRSMTLDQWLGIIRMYTDIAGERDTYSKEAYAALTAIAAMTITTMTLLREGNVIIRQGENIKKEV